MSTIRELGRILFYLTTGTIACLVLVVVLLVACGIDLVRRIAHPHLCFAI